VVHVPVSLPHVPSTAAFASGVSVFVCAVTDMRAAQVFPVALADASRSPTWTVASEVGVGDGAGVGVGVGAGVGVGEGEGTGVGVGLGDGVGDGTGVGLGVGVGVGFPVGGGFVIKAFSTSTTPQANHSG
jgi:hypothetical protein